MQQNNKVTQNNLSGLLGQDILSESVDGVVIRRTLTLKQINEVKVFTVACF